nr:cytochrome c oxidase subunit 3 [Euceros serricornis]
MNKLFIFYNHPFHLVTISPWPLIMSFNLMMMMLGAIKLFYDLSNFLLLLSMILIILSIFQWWRDIIRESTYQGMHSLNVLNLLRLGMILFIISEIFFFISFFWAFFHSFLSPNIDIGMNWPPLLIKIFNPYDIPLMNTIILLSSGVSITWSHYSIMNNNLSESSKSLLITVILGIYFTFLQYLEYQESMFTISDSIYGTTFFMITGFHGMHVIIGTIFILVTYLRLKKKHFSMIHFFGFEASSWYWHFVDVVWLFVYMFLYWWIF